MLGGLGAGSSKDKANLAQLRPELGLSLAKRAKTWRHKWNFLNQHNFLIRIDHDHDHAWALSPVFGWTFSPIFQLWGWQWWVWPSSLLLLMDLLNLATFYQLQLSCLQLTSFCPFMYLAWEFLTNVFSSKNSSIKAAFHSLKIRVVFHFQKNWGRLLFLKKWRSSNFEKNKVIFHF